MPGPAANAPDKVTDSHRESTGDTEALEEQLEGTRIIRKYAHS